MTPNETGADRSDGHAGAEYPGAEYPGADYTAPLARALGEAEDLIRSQPFVRTEDDVAEGMEYLQWALRGAIETRQHVSRSHPVMFEATGPYMKMGLDNPDTIYHAAHLVEGATYLVEGQRGTTADLAFQVLSGTYSADERAGSQVAFDDRELSVDAAGRYAFLLGPAEGPRPEPGTLGVATEAEVPYFDLAPDSSMLSVREVFSDWSAEEPGWSTIRRLDAAGTVPPQASPESMRKFYDKVGRGLVSRLETWIAFPKWFFGDAERNTLGEPRVTPGGLTSQYSSAGLFELADDEAMILSVPDSGAPYHGFQLGSMWYVSLDYVHHQTSLTTAQARRTSDGMFHYVVSARDPGIANWVETLGRREGIMQFRWQHIDAPITPEQGPTARVVKYSDLHAELPCADELRVTGEQWRARIAERQRAFARRLRS